MTAHASVPVGIVLASAESMGALLPMCLLTITQDQTLPESVACHLPMSNESFGSSLIRGA